MNKSDQIFFNFAKLLAATCGGLLIGLTVIPQATVAETPIYKSVSKTNLCPSIFYEMPHYDRVLVPSGCQPNAFTRRMIEAGKLPIGRGIGGEGEIIQAPLVVETLIDKPVPKVNPCPSIFYEKPHDEQVLVPQGCPANSFTRMMMFQ